MFRTVKRSRVLVSLEHRMLGVAFLALLTLMVWLTYAIFTKAFAEYARVTLAASKSGLQLSSRADVKIRGVVVGEVLSARSDGSGAELTLGLYPEAVETIPANVTALIQPKTLFGEKYVALQVPAQPATQSIEAGDVIEQSEVAIEVEKVLQDFYPLLRTVQPAELNYTLTAMATALEGRGEDLGENLTILDGYLRRTNPKIPALVEDLRLLGEVSEEYAAAMPDFARLLRNSVRTGETFVEKEQKIQALFDDVAGFSSTSRDFLEQNGDNIIRLGEVGQATLPMFARYSPEYPCLLQGMENWLFQGSNVWRGQKLHINLEQIPNQPTGYDEDDDPEYDAKNGPHCETLPAPPYSQANPGPQPAPGVVDDGVEDPHNHYRAATAFDLTSGFAGTTAERSVVAALAAPVMGVPADDVPDVATLLFGPLARGAEVNVR